MSKSTIRRAIVPAILFLSLVAADTDEKLPFLFWTPPEDPGPGMIDDMDMATLEFITESGSLIYFHPRREEDRFDVIVGQMIHAPIETVWDISSDHAGVCKYIPNTFDNCETVSRDGNTVVMDYEVHTSVTRFSFDMKIRDVIHDNPPYGWKLETVKGDLKGRRLELLLVPADEGRTMVFLRYFGSMRSMGTIIQMVLALVPDFETPVYSSAANYHLRCYRNEAERRAGYKPPRKPAELDFRKLDPDTMAIISRYQGGIIRETREGVTIDAGAFADMAAAPDEVYEVMTDFEHYDEFFPDSKTVVEKRDGNRALISQEINQLNVYIFKFVFDLHSWYELDPGRGMSYESIDGKYAGTRGSFTIMPNKNGKRTLVYGSLAAMIAKDDSLTMRIVRSGDFPFETMANFFFMRDTLNKMELEVNRRKKLASFNRQDRP